MHTSTCTHLHLYIHIKYTEHILCTRSWFWCQEDNDTQKQIWSQVFSSLQSKGQKNFNEIITQQVQTEHCDRPWNYIWYGYST